MKILVTFAGSAGPAAAVAGRIARVMTGLGVEVTVSAMNAVTTVKGFTAVIAGSMELGGKWAPEAVEFVRRNQVALDRKPFAIYTVIPSLADARGAESRMVVMQYTANVRSIVHPVSEGFFSGVVEKKEEQEPGERSKNKLSLLLGMLREGENRNQTEVEIWTAKLHEKIAPAPDHLSKDRPHGL